MDARKLALMALLGGMPPGALAQAEQRPGAPAPTPYRPPPYRGDYREDLSKYRFKVPEHEQKVIDKAAAKQLRKNEKRKAAGKR